MTTGKGCVRVVACSSLKGTRSRAIAALSEKCINQCCLFSLSYLSSSPTVFLSSTV